jgi:integrase/recombinase XerD
MLESYFVRPQTADKLRALWLGPAIDRYAEWLAARQAAKSTALRDVQVLVEFNRFAEARGIQRWDELPALIDDFVPYRLRLHGKRCRTAKYRSALLSQSRAPVEQLLRLLIPGYVGSQRRVEWPFQAEAPGFLEHLRDERGLRPDTLHGYAYQLRSFEAYLQQSGTDRLAEISPALLTQFLTERARNLAPGGIQGCSGALRVFLRFLHRQGIVAKDLSRAVPRGRTYRHAAIPRAIPQTDVERALAGIDRRSPLGKRDYAMLMLLATYGLRAQEVGALELSSIDWQRSQIHVLGRKAGNSTNYPLAAAVGEAIIDYLRNGRPMSDDRHVFLTVKAPFHSLRHFVVSGRASVYLHRAGIKVSRAGSHTFRHSCVQRLVEADVSFKAIGDYVGHRSEATTQIYAKVALHKLRALTLGDAEDAL